MQLGYVRQFRTHQVKLESITKKLAELNPKEKLLGHKHQLAATIARLDTVIIALVKSHQNKLSLVAASLNTLSPLSTLSRGYSITRDKKTRDVINTVAQTSKDQKLSILLSDGEIDCRVN
jgi:exodeoxyribonuclease VII large subunit